MLAAASSAVLGAVIGSGASQPDHHRVVARGRQGITEARKEQKLVHTHDPVPILIYHVIGGAPAGAPYPKLFVKSSVFEQQMHALADRGYSAVTLDEVHRAWFKDGLVPEKPIVISFDDGYRGQYTDALPVMDSLHWPGVLNLKVNTLTQGELGVRAVREMVGHGWELDAHTINHLDVSRLGGANLRREVAGSRQILRKRFGVPVDFFCYPAGEFDPESVRAVRAAGYIGAETEQPGLAAPNQMFKLRRIRIEARDGVRGLEEKLSRAEA